LLAAVAAQGVEDVAGEALRVDANDGGGAVDVAHDEGDRAFDASYRGRNGVVAGLGTVNDALEAEDAEGSPAGGEIGVGYLVDCGKGHLFLIIRLRAHRDWIRLGVRAMQNPARESDSVFMRRKVGL
jgi:hypothetical protein